jgi:hypothetical protein
MIKTCLECKETISVPEDVNLCIGCYLVNDAEMRGLTGVTKMEKEVAGH